MAKNRAQMKKLVNLIILAFLAHASIGSNVFPVQAQREGQKNIAKLNDDLLQGLNTSPKIPSPPAVALPQLSFVTTSAEKTLNWRARALALANEYPLKKNSIAWALPVSYGKGQLLLKQAIMQIGLTLLSEYDDAGQFLISLSELNNKGDVIVISQPAGEKCTLFKMHIYTGSHVADIEQIKCLPDIMRDLRENQGLWQ